MINKTEAGKRIIALRKELGYSQSDFADKLNVTPQAVSKWETGLALPDIERLLTMSGIFKITINEILTGKNILYKIANRPFEMSDIAYFVQEKDDDYYLTSGWIEKGYLKKGWDWKKDNKADMLIDIAKKITGHGGLILELGAGPGGGLMPYTLFEKHDAELIISDISPTIVREWKKVFEKEFFPPNVYYAALDSCDLPFEDNSIDVISIGGFGNTDGDRFKAVREIYRVLKPGGLYVATDALITKERLRAYPENVQKIMLEKAPYIFEDYYETSLSAGFKKIDNILGGEQNMTEDDNTVSELGRELGVEIIYTWYTRYCVK
jgi:ubiquinone/menaquinone biosynthesis C-methylase UbiE/DNA-binding XRE family transcriptional regulator